MGFYGWVSMVLQKLVKKAAPACHKNELDVV